MQKEEVMEFPRKKYYLEMQRNEQVSVKYEQCVGNSFALAAQIAAK